MNKSYDHTSEDQIYSLWNSANAFAPKKSAKNKQYCIVMPPPNANENLHVGHARFVTIQDILIRFKRMQGYSTLWLPGADHAGIETQFVFEKKLKQKGKSRFDYPRDELYKMIWEYVHEFKDKMYKQLETLGASCDWSRERFTLDPKITKIVHQTFKDLYDKGLVYRGNQIVNYCPRCGTNYSDLEVEHEQKEGQMYYLDYGLLTIATTRPETIFADVAVAVHPKGEFKNLVGKKATIPLINRQIPIIADILVDPEFGTGALKITPAHDKLDFEIGQKHNLPMLSVLDEKGRMINTPKQFVGVFNTKARKLVVEELEKNGTLQKIETINHTVGTCYKCKSIIEPSLSQQWFIKVSPLTKKSLQAIQDKQIKFASKSQEKIAKHWLRNLKDWNISRQIVWGIPIPAWQCQSCRSWIITSGNKPKECDKCQSNKLKQDSDTFDTWFSSSQWPFATLKSNSTKDFEDFYPTDVMETAYDILPFWVVRMIMIGIFATDKIPFKNVLIHGLVRDKHGDKISKSKGNVINPLEMTDKYGADALRMSLIWGSLVEHDIALSEQNIKAQRNLGNKLWNISRFMTLENPKPDYKKRAPHTIHQDDKQIISNLRKSIKKISKDIEKYRLNEAAEELYDFIWNRLGNNYLERIKNRKSEAQPILEYIIQETLKLSHPFMPFTTEAIWQKTLSCDDHKLLINESWPKT